MEGNPKQRHRIRFWRCPEGWYLPGGQQVDWLAAGTFDTAVGLSFFTLQVTHLIDADTDVERDYVIRPARDRLQPPWTSRGCCRIANDVVVVPQSPASRSTGPG